MCVADEAGSGACSYLFFHSIFLSSFLFIYFSARMLMCVCV